jgi:hypothetical protein
MENQQEFISMLKDGIDRIVAANLTLAIVMHEQNPNKNNVPWKSPQLLYHDIIKSFKTGR